MLRMAWQTILHFRGLLIPVMVGVAIAGTVIIGALIVGDCVRGSLRHIALDRIGGIDRILIAPRWFDPTIVDQSELPKNSSFALLLPQATAQFDQRIDNQKTTFRANEMSLLGVDDSFWQLSTHRPSQKPSGEQVVLNRSLAEALHVNVGDRITLSLPAQSVVPADSTLGKRDLDTVYLPRWEVIEIVSDSGLARFSLRSDQRPSLNAFVNRAALQNALGIGTKVNTLLAAKADRPIPNLLTQLRPKLKDVGLRLLQVNRLNPKNEKESIIAYSTLTSDQMLMGERFAKRVVNCTKEFEPIRILTYLANGVSKKSNADPTEEVGRESVPYSTISAVEPSFMQHLLRTARASNDILVGDNWVVINQWLADQLKCEIGDTLTIDYFLPETVEGTEVEKSFEATVGAIAPLAEPKLVRQKPVWIEPPTPFNDPAWTPEVPGITDSASINDWDTPFPLTRPRAKEDDVYWDAHGLTPKLFVSYEMGKKLFGSRFGDVTSIRYETIDEEKLRTIETKILEVVTSDLASFGWRDIPLREQQIRRSSGTTPFDALFLALSFFLIAAALLLVILLFRLSIEKRANHWGALSAMGWTRGKIRNLLLSEGIILAAAGAAMGIAGGLGYAYAMVSLLKSWWLGAITVSFLDYYVNPISLVVGWIASWLAGIAAIFVASRNLKKVSIASLLKGRVDEILVAVKRAPLRFWAALVIGLFGVVILLTGQRLQGQAQAGAFVGGGMLFMITGLLLMWHRLQTRQSRQNALASAGELAASNAKRAPTRSILAIGLVAIASFLILSMSLFQAAPTEPGLGGFSLMGKSQSPIFDEMGSPETRTKQLGPQADALNQTEIVSMRLRGGDDASCNNLYQADEPQVLGVSARIKQIDRDSKNRSAFAWFQTKDDNAKDASPWEALEAVATGNRESPIPVVLDQNTALWALHLGGYIGETFSFSFDDQTIWFQTVGVLQNTILQGSLLIGEDNFRRVFPAISGYRFFLVKTTADGDVESTRQLLENGWQAYGLSLVESPKVLAQLLAVQNTYLSAFQMLGTFGLLLGTIGLGISQLRSAMERRSELAAMRAIGFTKGRLTWLLTLENVWQLIRGMLIGGVSAGLATIPAFLSGQPFSGVMTPLMMLAGVVGIGLLASWVSAKLAMRWPLVKALKSTF